MFPIAQVMSTEYSDDQRVLDGITGKMIELPQDALLDIDRKSVIDRSIKLQNSIYGLAGYLLNVVAFPKKGMIVSKTARANSLSTTMVTNDSTRIPVSDGLNFIISTATPSESHYRTALKTSGFLREAYFRGLMNWDLPKGIDIDETDKNPNVTQIICNLTPSENIANNLATSAARMIKVPNSVALQAITPEALSQMSPDMSIVLTQLGNDARNNPGAIKKYPEALKRAHPIDVQTISDLMQAKNESGNFPSVAEQMSTSLTSAAEGSAAMALAHQLMNGYGFEIIERMVPGLIFGDKEATTTTILGIMAFAAAESIYDNAVKNESDGGDRMPLWVLQADGKFAKLLRELFGEESISIVARTVQIKFDRKGNQVLDVCNTIVLDLKSCFNHAEKNGGLTPPSEVENLSPIQRKIRYLYHTATSILKHKNKDAKQKLDDTQLQKEVTAV